MVHANGTANGASQVGLVVKNLPANAGDVEMWVRFLGREDPLEKGMATNSSILAWRISWTEEPRGLQSMGSQKSDTTEVTASAGQQGTADTHTTNTSSTLTHAPLFHQISLKKKEHKFKSKI